MSAMRSTAAIRCVSCHTGELIPTKLTMMLRYDGQSFTVDDGDALVCAACGDELIGAWARHSCSPIAPSPQTRG